MADRDPSLSASEALTSTPSGKPGSSGPDNAPLHPPPEYAHYEPEYFTKGNSNIVSYDPHLNSDGSFFGLFIEYGLLINTFNHIGEALYRFLLSQAPFSPIIRISCHGTHTESRERTRFLSDEKYTETVTVTDFNFCIDIESNAPVVQWSVADDEPAYRGLMVREFEGSTGTGRQVAKVIPNKKWEKGLGLPPWVRTDGSGAHFDEFDGLRSSKTLRQWADEYCASPKKMKEFVYKKVLFRIFVPILLFLNLWTPQVIYGWNMEQIVGAIRSTIRSSRYDGYIRIRLNTYGSKICIRPAEFSMGRKLLFWLYKHFRSRDGGRWEVCGSAYPLKQSVPTTRRAQGSARYMQTPTCSKILLGVKEGEWFRNWEGNIIRAVRQRYQSSTPLNSGFTGSAVRASDLDGYNET